MVENLLSLLSTHKFTFLFQRQEKFTSSTLITVEKALKHTEIQSGKKHYDISSHVIRTVLLLKKYVCM